MKAIYFVESNGVKYYKTDTFWSKSKDYKQAKLHNDSEYDIFFESLLHYPTNKFDFIDFYDNSIYGYQTIDDSNNVTDTHYVKLIKYEDYKFIGIDYKQINRDNKINDILLKK